VSTAIAANAQKTYSTVKARKSFYKSLISKNNSPSVKLIFDADKTNSFNEYVDGSSELELLSDFGTVIHELLHGYNNSSSGGHNYFITESVRIFVPYKNIYNSKKLNNFVRSSLQDSIFRYGIYVGGKKSIHGIEGDIPYINATEQTECFSIQKGIYGMLEEFCAYYYGNLATYELCDYYKINHNNKEAWNTYKNDVMGDAVAYYEFNLFMAWYILYAKENEPAVYKDILENKQLRVVYTLINKKYSKLLEDIDEKIKIINEASEPELLDVLTFDGSEEDVFRFLQLSGLDEEALYIEKEKIINGKKVIVKESILRKEEFNLLKAEYTKLAKQMASFGSLTLFFTNTNAQINYLQKQYTPEVNKTLDELKVKNVTLANYKEFIP